MGLACSYAIVKKLGGDITIKESRIGLTIVAFKIPVKKKESIQFDRKPSNNDIINQGPTDYEFVSAITSTLSSEMQ
jgi:hypothetical protein